MEELELLYDHYKETFSIIKEQLSSRNKFFILLFLIMTVQFLFAVSPDSFASIIIKIVDNTYKIDVSSQMNVIQSLLWIVLLYFTMRYYQTNVYIERQYRYIHKLEDVIANLLNAEFDRESFNYLSSFPKMSNMIDIIYKWIFPLLYCLIVIIKICSEISTRNYNISFFINMIISLSCLLLTILYLIFLHKENKDKIIESKELNTQRG